MHRLLIMGPPGAGKGSQAVMIKEYYHIPHISTGDMFREAIAKKLPLGVLAKEYMDKGELVPDSVTVGLVRERLREEDCKTGFLLDGFPRTLAQAAALDDILREYGSQIDHVINLDVNDAVLIERIAGRRICRQCGASYHIVNRPSKTKGVCDICGGPLYQRPDDNEETVKNRIRVYQEQTKPILDYYQDKGLVINIDGSQNVEDIFLKLQKILGGMNDIN